MNTTVQDILSRMKLIEQEIAAMTVNELVDEIDSKAHGFKTALSAMLRGQTQMRSNAPVNSIEIEDATKRFPFLDDMFPELCEHVATLPDSADVFVCA